MQKNLAVKMVSADSDEPFTAAKNDIFYDESGCWLQLRTKHILLIYNGLPLTSACRHRCVSLARTVSKAVRGAMNGILNCFAFIFGRLKYENS